MFPAFAHFRRTATKDTVLNGQQIKKGDKVVMWYPSSNRDETRYEDPDRFDVLRNPEHQAFGAGGRHFCLGTALARLELQDPLRGDPRPLPRDAARRQAPLRRVGLPQPAEDAPRSSFSVGPIPLRLARRREPNGLGEPSPRSCSIKRLPIRLDSGASPVGSRHGYSNPRLWDRSGSSLGRRLIPNLKKLAA